MPRSWKRRWRGEGRLAAAAGPGRIAARSQAALNQDSEYRATFPGLNLFNSFLGEKGAYDFTDHLAAFPNRVLFVTGGDSEVLGAGLQERQRQFFPASALVTVSGAGHDVAWTHTAETLAAIHAYLGTVQR